MTVNFSLRFKILLGVFVSFFGQAVVDAQVSSTTNSQPVQPKVIGAPSVSSKVGQKQTRIQASSPTERVNNRIENRVRNRISNRIDSNYNPKASATSSFEAAAGEQARSSVGRKRK